MTNTRFEELIINTAAALQALRYIEQLADDPEIINAEQTLYNEICDVELSVTTGAALYDGASHGFDLPASCDTLTLAISGLYDIADALGDNDALYDLAEQIVLSAESFRPDIAELFG